MSDTALAERYQVSRATIWRWARSKRFPGPIKLSEGCFALYLKFHHALVDGEAAAQLIGSLHTLTPGFDQAGLRSEHAIVADREPNTLELVSRAVANRSRQLVGAGDTARLGQER